MLCYIRSMLKHTSGLAALLTAGLCVIALAGCGGSTNTSSGGAAPSTAAPVAVTTGYHNMYTLDASVKQQILAKLQGEGEYDTTVSDVSCFETSARTALCHVTSSTGPVNVSVDIAADGSQWAEVGVS